MRNSCYIGLGEVHRYISSQYVYQGNGPDHNSGSVGLSERDHHQRRSPDLRPLPPLNTALVTRLLYSIHYTALVTVCCYTALVTATCRRCSSICIDVFLGVFNPRPYGGGVGATPPPPEVFRGIAKKWRRVAPPGFGLPYGANLAQFLAKKIDRVRSGHGAMTS